MTKIKPLGNRILVCRSKAKTTKGGILLPDTAQEKPKEGKVIAVGPGKVNDEGVLEPVSIKVGDQVLFTAYSGTEVKASQGDGEELLILCEDDVLGVLA